MFSAPSLLAILTLALAVAATPLIKRDASTITLSVAKRVNITGSGKDILLHDQARIKALRARAEAKPGSTKPKGPVSDTKIVGSIPATNQAVDYVVNVSVTVVTYGYKPILRILRWISEALLPPVSTLGSPAVIRA